MAPGSGRPLKLTVYWCFSFIQFQSSIVHPLSDWGATGEEHRVGGEGMHSSAGDARGTGQTRVKSVSF